MSSSLPEGFSLRAPTFEDVDAAAAVVTAEDRAFRGEPQWGADDQRDWWSQLDMDRNAWLVETNGRVVAAASLMQRGEKLDGWISVDPAFTGQGIGSALIGTVEHRARELGGHNVKLGSYGENVVGKALLERSGYREVRHFYEMRIDLDGPPPEPEWPTGLSVAPFDLDAARKLHAAINDAFADEWNFHQRTFEEWRALRLDVPNFDPTLWFLAWEGDEVAGFVLSSAKQYGGPWVALVGVRKPWRQRGLGLALLRQAFGEFHRRGERWVALGVDAQNPTGATRLYERAGMYVRSQDVIYEKDLP
jgi:mycothiol synthase